MSICPFVVLFCHVFLLFELSFFPFLSPVDGEADVTDENKQGEPVRRGAWAGRELGLSDGDIYIMMQFCLCVTKNHHFLLGVSCDHLNYP